MNGLLIDRSRSVVIFAAQSRAFVFILQFFFNYLIPDHNADVFKPESPKNVTVLNRIASNFFDGLTARWDGNYFMHIAEHGYTYENTLVFFPLFPFFTKILASTLLLPLQYLISFRNVLHCSAVILNFLAFLISACSFYKLSCKVLKQEHLAYRAAQLFCVNPASIFFSAAYSESIFSACTFAGLLKLHEGSYLKASLCFAFASATRSNGIVNAGFIVYSYLLCWWGKLNGSGSTNSSASRVTNHVERFITGALVFVWEVLSMFLWAFISCSLFLSHQAYCYLMYCGEMRNEFKNTIPKHVIDYGKSRGYNMPGYGPIPKWCHNKVPLSYSEIQGQHWNIGLFRYYEVNQLPNFLLALPLLVVSLSFCVSYIKHRPRYCLKLGLTSSKKEKQVKTKENLLYDDEFIYYHQNECFVYVVQLAVLVIFGTVYMHIQVITRMVCSSCPAFYWYLAEKCMSKDERMAIKIISKKEFGKSSGGKMISECIKQTHKESITDSSHDGNREKEILKRDGSPKRANVRSRTNQIGGTEASKHESQTVTDCTSAVVEVFKDSEVIDWSEGPYNRMISIYFHLYLFVGVAAFSNFFPWT